MNEFEKYFKQLEDLDTEKNSLQLSDRRLVSTVMNIKAKRPTEEQLKNIDLMDEINAETVKYHIEDWRKKYSILT